MTCALLYVALASLSADPMVVHLGDTRRVEVSVELGREQLGKLKQTPVTFEVGRQSLRLSILDDDGTVGPPIFARYAIKRGRLVLSPRYPLTRGVTYEAIASLPGSRQVRKQFQLPNAPPGKPPRVTAVYPSGDKLPANCLKFYVHFSQPMREGRDIFEQITIEDDKGKVVPDPWRRVELWNDEATRLTLWIHPGRIKQGVNLREDFGPVLKPGGKYRLVVAPAVRGVDGLPLGSRFEKRFIAVAEDHQRPMPSEWKVALPAEGTREPLSIDLREPLDQALLHKLLKVRGRSGQKIPGTIQVDDGESRWRFVPAEDWADGQHYVQVDGRLEDLAGNTPLRVFDADLLEKQGAAPLLRLPFQPH